MAAATARPKVSEPLDRFLDFVARTQSPGEWQPWLDQVLEAMARLIGARTATALFLDGGGSLVVEAVWPSAGAPAGPAAGEVVASSLTAAAVAGSVRTLRGVEAQALARHGEVVVVPLLVDTERVGVVALADTGRDALSHSKSKRTALEAAGRYLGGARRRFELTRSASDAAREAQRLRRMYRALSQCNQSIVRAHGRVDLLNRVCEAAATYLSPDGRGVAMIGFLDESGERFEIACGAGGPTWFTRRLPPALATRAARGEGLVGAALRTGSVQAGADLAADATDSPARALALRAGYRSFAAAPLSEQGRAGALLLFAADAGFFTERDRELVAELAADISYGLAALCANERLRERESTLKAVLDQAAEGVMLTDATGRIQQVNRTLADLVGRSVPELLGQDMVTLMMDADRERMTAWRRAAAARRVRARSANFVGEAMARHANGSAVPVAVRVGGVKAPSGTHLLASLLDLRESKALQARLERMALRDPVTDLWNRRAFGERFGTLAAAARAAGQRLGVALVDVDDFRSLNDVFGHSAGDQVLRTLARRLSRQVGEGGVVGRVGGDEFALLELLPEGLTPEAWLGRILDVTERDVRFGPRRGHMGISVGVAVLPEDGGDLETLFARADRAMYSVKSGGGHGGRLFDPAVERQQEEIRLVRDGLSEALRAGGLVLHYEPQVDMLARRVVGFEALLRWHDPARGLRMPGEFLPLLRDETLICRVGAWVLGSAVEQWCAWRSEYSGARLAVNAAPQWFLSGGFLADVRTAVGRLGPGGAHGLELEITETAALQDIGRAREIIAALHDLGIGVALDDFGTGYASLGYLHELNVDSIKVDISFTRRLLDSTDSWSIVQAILLMAAGSERAIVAEGVESPAIEEAVLRLGVRVGQGYAYTRPLPAEEVMPWVHAFAARSRDGGPEVGPEVLRGSEFLTAVYLHLRWMQRVVVATRYPRALEKEATLGDDDDCPLLRWGDGRTDPLVAELVAAHASHHRAAARLVNERPADARVREAAITAFVEAQGTFFSRASAALFAAAARP